ncbi:MAG: FMN-dependent NADH-azoreductase [Calditrichaeota bacterium]|nr:MAG: FMN-dependent NADH-azoreductase [Calditrichota bacterium]
MYVILGATGNTGNVIAKILLQAGKTVRIIGRGMERLQALIDQGAEAAVGDVQDIPFLMQSFKGANAVYVMIPPNLKSDNFRAYQDKTGESVVTALKGSTVKYIVNLSSIGADLPKGTGPIAGAYAMEQRLNTLETKNILHLRPAYFMENLYAGIGLIKNMGINGSAINGKFPFPMIATRDIGEYAAKRLLKLDFQRSSVQELLGQRDVALAEASTILGKAIGLDELKYQQFSDEEAKAGMIQAGLSPDVARLYIEMSEAFNTGKVVTPARSTENTTPTSIEAFSEIFSKVYHAS